MFPWTSNSTCLASSPCTRLSRARSTISEDRLPPSHLSPSGLAIRSTDRKSTRLNSSHLGISYAVFCLKKNRAGVVDRPDEKDLRPDPADDIEHRSHGPVTGQVFFNDGATTEIYPLSLQDALPI